MTQIMYFRRARVQQGRVLPDELINEIRDLLGKIGPLNLRSFTQLYYIIFRKPFPLKSLNLDNGVWGFFELISDVVMATKVNNENTMICLRNDLTTPVKILADSQTVMMHRYEIAEDRHKILFDPSNSILWNKWTHLLETQSYRIVPSPYEKMCNQNKHDYLFRNDLNRIQTVLRNHPYGIPLHEVAQHLQIIKRDFNVVSTAELVHSWTELFFIKEPTHFGGFPLVFDARTTTYNFVEELEKVLNQRQSIESLVFEFIKSGLYQKTLLLLHETKSKGLRLNVWRESIRVNFLKQTIETKNNYYDRVNGEPSDCSQDIANKNIIGIFTALHKLGLISMSSIGKCKNDLRIFLPLETSFSFDDIMFTLIKNYQKQIAEIKFKNEIRDNEPIDNCVENCENNPPQIMARPRMPNQTKT